MRAALDEEGVAVGAVAAAIPNSENEVLGAVVLSFAEDKQAMGTFQTLNVIR